ncbi:accessory gene regulator B family protein [Paenibacillus sp. O199]|uniref:accessory gene regulator B family protein n=1 Tax=Paenibacillus sp. O199 TaxID=1643925 RepID=UPI0007BF2A6B|nr:accessory gene regulator B family protein [Paenibacillus sp. O199]
MIDNYVNNISRKLVDRFPTELPPYGITRYGIKFIVSNILPIMLLLLVGLMFNIYNNVLISILSFSALRLSSGGYHSEYPEICLIYSSILMLTIATFGNLFEGVEWIFSIAALILVTIFAPSNIENQTKILSKYFIYLKYIAILTVLVGALIRDPIISCSMFAQSLLLIRLKGGDRNE